MDVGKDESSPVTDDYSRGGGNAFTGTIKWVQVDLEDDDVSHLHDPELVYRRIMSRQ